MHEFFAANARAIHAITLKDTLYARSRQRLRGEDARRSAVDQRGEVQVLSAEDLLGKAGQLGSFAMRWSPARMPGVTDAMLERMVSLAKETGDIRQKHAGAGINSSSATTTFWADHFGGVFVFVDEKITTVICDRMPRVPPVAALQGQLYLDP